MLKKHNQLFLTVMLIVDVGVVSLSWIMAYHIRFTFEIIPVYSGTPTIDHYINFLPIVVLIWLFSLRFSDLYSPMRSNSRFNEYFKILKAATIAAVLTMAAAFFYREFSMSRMVMGIFWGASAIFIMVSHSIVRFILREIRKMGYNLRFVLIVGSGKLAQTLAETFSRHPESGMKVVGMLADHKADVGKNFSGYEVIGTVEEIKRIIDRINIDQIFIALPHQAYERLEKTLMALENETVDIRLAPDIMNFIQLNASVEDFDGVPIVSLSESPIYGWNVVLKRVFDVTFSLLFIAVSSPLMALIALIIKLESPGSVFYHQERMSLGGEPFFIYKFRSMVLEAEKDTGAIWARENDNRRTKFGELLRATSLDELPQLFNVLKGDMSLVGPRPERPVFVDSFRKSIPMYMLRHKVKAGITGWAQVNGWRGNTSLEKRVEFDLYYIENWSILFDLKILWLTIWRGFVNKHAY